jgi:hypothetical protein
VPNSFPLLFRVRVFFKLFHYAPFHDFSNMESGVITIGKRVVTCKVLIGGIDQVLFCISYQTKCICLFFEGTTQKATSLVLNLPSSNESRNSNFLNERMGKIDILTL